MSDLLAEHLPMVYRMAWMLTGNQADAEDLAHDAMVQALTAFGRFRAEAKLSTWLTTILVNRYRTWCRARRTHRRLAPKVAVGSETDAEPSREVQRSEEQEAVRRALERLDEDERMLVALSVYDELDSTEIGRVPGVPPGTVRYRLHQAREKLRELMEEKPR
jgi:RNA polymerase sigma-70 factor (ECF subfamily)